MNNPIPKSNLWATPINLESLYAQLDQYTGEQAALAMHVAMLTMNTCHKLVADEMLKAGATDPAVLANDPQLLADIAEAELLGLCKAGD